MGNGWTLQLAGVRTLIVRGFACITVMAVLAAGCTGGSGGQAITSPSSPSASASPSPSPSPTETALPTTTVYNDISTAFIQVGDAKSVKRTRVTLVFQKLKDGAKLTDPDRFEGPEISHSPKLTEPSPLEMDPGQYEVLRIVFPPAAMGTGDDVQIGLLNGKGTRLHGPTFTVPEGDCAYLGALLLTFIRLEPTKKVQDQFDLIKDPRLGSATAEATILKQGSVLFFVNDVDSITVIVNRKSQKANGAQACKVSAFKDPVR